jgi:uncharacterized membrane protein YagU involved in acid resistance
LVTFDPPHFINRAVILVCVAFPSDQITNRDRVRIVFAIIFHVITANRHHLPLAAIAANSLIARNSVARFVLTLPLGDAFTPFFLSSCTMSVSDIYLILIWLCLISAARHAADLL